MLLDEERNGANITMDRIDSGLASAKDDDTRLKSIAYKRREWLICYFWKPASEKVIAAYQKYERISSCKANVEASNKGNVSFYAEVGSNLGP